MVMLWGQSFGALERVCVQVHDGVSIRFEQELLPLCHIWSKP